jgi:hypothetical protein
MDISVDDFIGEASNSQSWSRRPSLGFYVYQGESSRHFGRTALFLPGSGGYPPSWAGAPTLRSPVDIHVFARNTFNLGREDLDIGDGGSVGLYSTERSLIDVIRLRHREGSDVAWEALRRWLARRGSQPAALLKMAKHFHGAERAVRNALDVVL